MLSFDEPAEMGSFEGGEHVADKDKDPDSNIGVGGRAMFWEGVFGTTSGKPHEPPEETKKETEHHPREDVLMSYDHREVRPSKPKECA